MRTHLGSPVAFLCASLIVSKTKSFSWKPSGFLNNVFGREKSTSPSPGMSPAIPIIQSQLLPSWGELSTLSKNTATGAYIATEENLRELGEGSPHTDAKLRLFGTKGEPRVTYFRDTAAWCPYCQKVWILLEEKKIPYKIVKINMRSYGDKPAEFFRMVPNGLLPAIIIDGQFQTESIEIMLNLERTFSGDDHPSMWPSKSSPELARAQNLMKMERNLFSLWCNLVFRPAMGDGPRKRFEQGLDDVNRELTVTEGPWFLNDLSIVDLQYITHVERMCASVAYWSGLKIRGDGRWPAIERWMDAFEARPSYMATKSDYYTHVMDIPPQYGPGFFLPGSEQGAAVIDGSGGVDGSWRLPLPSFSPSDIEPVSDRIDPGDDASRHEAAYKLAKNHEAVMKFALRGAGKPGAKQFQAPLADPYAIPALEYSDDMDALLRQVTHALLQGYTQVPPLQTIEPDRDSEDGQRSKAALVKSLAYFRDRIGVPRDMSYPAARQLRAHLNWVAEQL